MKAKFALFRVDAATGKGCVLEGDVVVRLATSKQEVNAVAMKNVKAGEVGPVQYEEDEN